MKYPIGQYPVAVCPVDEPFPLVNCPVDELPVIRICASMMWAESVASKAVCALTYMEALFEVTITYVPIIIYVCRQAINLSTT